MGRHFAVNDFMISWNPVMSTTTPLKLCISREDLLKQDDWTDWQDSEYLQLNQYDSQGMFGSPVLVNPDDEVFHLVWTYNVKALDGRKKAVASVTALVVRAQSKFSTKPMQTASTKPVHVSFMLLLPPKIYLSTVLTSVTPSLRHHLRNKASTYAPTGPFTNGGNTTKVDLPSHPTRTCNSCPVSNARSPRISPFVGKACGFYSL
jgi:hypothetical protein